MPQIIIIPEGATVIWGEDGEGAIQYQKVVWPDGSEFYTWVAETGAWGGPTYVSEQQIEQMAKDGRVFIAQNSVAKR